MNIRTTYHLRIDLHGALRHWQDHLWRGCVTDDDGRIMTPFEVKDAFLTLLGSGKRFIPMDSSCDKLRPGKRLPRPSGRGRGAERVNAYAGAAIPFSPVECDDLAARLRALSAAAALSRALALLWLAPNADAASALERQAIEMLDLLNPAIRAVIALREWQLWVVEQ